MDSILMNLRVAICHVDHTWTEIALTNIEVHYGWPDERPSDIQAEMEAVRQRLIWLQPETPIAIIQSWPAGAASNPQALGSYTRHVEGN